MTMNLPTQQKTVLITGASEGLGAEFAKIFAADGYSLILIARHKIKLEKFSQELQTEFNIPVKIISKDLSKPGSAQEIFQELEEENIQIDILVNNAGTGVYGLFNETNLEDHLYVINLNIVSLVSLTYLFLPGMKARHDGKILNLSSIAAFQPGPKMAIYYATKAFVLSFSEALSTELEDKNITVTALCPGPTITTFQKKSEVGQTYMFKFAMNASVVAKTGYDALMKGKRVEIAGLRNKIVVEAERALPKKLVTRISGMVLEKKAHSSSDKPEYERDDNAHNKRSRKRKIK